MKRLSPQSFERIEMAMRHFNVLRGYLGFSDIPSPGLDYLVKYFRQPTRFEIVWTNVWLYDPLVWEAKKLSVSEIEPLRHEHAQNTSNHWFQMVQEANRLRQRDKDELASFERGLRHERLNRLEELFVAAGKNFPEEWAEWFESHIDKHTGTITTFFEGSGIPCPASPAWVARSEKRKRRLIEKYGSNYRAVV